MSNNNEKIHSFRLPTYYKDCDGNLTIGTNPLSPMVMETYMGDTGVSITNWNTIGTPSIIPLTHSDSK